MYDLVVPTRFRVSIVTPTWNRAPFLRELFMSLCTSSVMPHEWIVIDDGSTDATGAQVSLLAGISPFRVAYCYQKNAGQNAAMNRGFELATGDFILKLDSDDLLHSDGLRSVERAWFDIPIESRSRFAGVSGLSRYPDGSVVGDVFPQTPLDSDYVSVRVEGGIRGDKAEVVRRDLVGGTTFFTADGIRLPGSGYMYLRLSESGLIFRHINEVVKVKRYQSDGISAQNIVIRRLLNRKAYAIMDAQLLLSNRLSRRTRIYVILRVLAFASPHMLSRAVWRRQMALLIAGGP